MTAPVGTARSLSRSPRTNGTSDSNYDAISGDPKNSDHTEIYPHAAGELLVQQQFGICETRALIEEFEATLVILEICHVTGGTKFFSLKLCM